MRWAVGMREGDGWTGGASYNSGRERGYKWDDRPTTDERRG